MPEPVCQPRRPLGRTGFVATPLGIGDLADRAIPLDTCVATARRALDAGLNLIDTAPSYEDGYSEAIVGRAVREFGAAGGGRDSLFVIDKIDDHDAPVTDQIDASLTRLGLTHTDAFVYHALSSMDTWNRIATEAMHELSLCIKAGKTRFKGISSHSPEVLHAAVTSGLCDLVLFPIGAFVDPGFLEILPLAKQHKVATVCFKSFGAGKLVGDTTGYQRPLQSRPRGKASSGGSDDTAPTLPRLTIEDCLHYTLSHDPDVALLGMSFPNEQDAAFAAYTSYRGPLPADRLADIRRRAAQARQFKGPCWWNPNPEA